MSLRPSPSLYQDRGSRITINPESEPVSLMDVKRHLRIDDNSDDIVISDQIIEARSYIENETNVAMISQTWRLAIDRWPAGGEAWWDGVREMSITELYRSNSLQSVIPPRWPLASITSITTFDEDSTPTSVTTANVFDVDTYRIPGRITLKRGQTWPIALRASNAIEIVYVAGYANAAAVPATMKRAVKQLAAFMYSNRGDDCDPADAYHKSGAAGIMGQFRAVKI